MSDSELLSWVSEKSSEIGFHWWSIPAHFPFIGFTSAVVRLELDGRVVGGAGVGASDEQALVKALTECIERTALLVPENTLASSNGTGAHTRPPLAAQSAIRELVERDRFLCHYLTKKPFRPLDVQSLGKEVPWISHALEELSSEGMEVFVGEMHRAVGVRSAVVVGQEKSGACHVSTAAHFSLETAVASALLELGRGIAMWNRDGELGRRRVLTLPEFLGMPSVSVFDHGALAMSGIHGDVLSSLFPTTTAGREYAQQFVAKEDKSVDLISVEPLALPRALEGCPVCVVRASSPFLQDAWWGPTTPERVNIARLRSFTGNSELEFTDLEVLPHPLD